MGTDRKYIDDRIWNDLYKAIEEERVVPVIGEGLFYVEGSDRVKYQDFIFGRLIEKFGGANPNIQAEDFADIETLIKISNLQRRLYNDDSTNSDIYLEIDSISRQIKPHINEYIIDFLKIGRFPLIISTSPYPILEEHMQQAGIPADVRIYRRSKRSDISGSLSKQNPTLYYLFGKSTSFNQSYMATEDDFLEYLHMWHDSETRPPLLCEYLRDKILLVLGCDYPNWLFRFFWHSMKNIGTSHPERFQGVVANDKGSVDFHLKKFLSRLNTRYLEEGNTFLSELTDRWAESVHTAAAEPPAAAADSEAEVFISYASEDYAIARRIADTLIELGARVWFDKAELQISDQYTRLIEERIQKAKRFMPVISATTLQPGRRFFKKEWKMAIDESDFRLGEPFFAPIIIDDTDFANAREIPTEFKNAHCYHIGDEGFRTALKHFIRSYRQ